MSLLYDEAQQAIAAEAARVLAAETRTETLLALADREGQHDGHFWDIAKGQGWTGIAIPEEYGGLGLGLIEQGLIAEACGANAVGAPFLTTSFGAAQAILAHGDMGICSRLLPALASGEIVGALAFAERQSMLPPTPALRFRDGRLEGEKPAVTAGLAADVVVVLAADGAGVPILAVAVMDGVERLLPGTISNRPAPASFDPTRLAADLRFNSTPATPLASGQAALNAALRLLCLQSVVVAHEQMGGAGAMMKKARDFALERRAFGQPIANFQTVKHRIAELYALVELARANAIHAASRVGEGDFVSAAAAARLSATEAYDTAARDCIQIHGGIGVTWEAGLHLHMRRARSLAIEQGSGWFWEDQLVSALEREAA